MIMIFGIDIGTLSFFVFSFLVGIVVFVQALFFCKEETTNHRIIRGVIGAAYATITVLAFAHLSAVGILE